MLLLGLMITGCRSFIFHLQIPREIYCVHAVNYTVTLKDSESNVIVNEVHVRSDRCDGSTCSISLSPMFPTSPFEQSYRVSVTAINIYGSSNPAIFNIEIGKPYTE